MGTDSNEVYNYNIFLCMSVRLAPALFVKRKESDFIF